MPPKRSRSLIEDRQFSEETCSPIKYSPVKSSSMPRPSFSKALFSQVNVGHVGCSWYMVKISSSSLWFCLISYPLAILFGCHVFEWTLWLGICKQWPRSTGITVEKIFWDVKAAGMVLTILFITKKKPVTISWQAGQLWWKSTTHKTHRHKLISSRGICIDAELCRYRWKTWCNYHVQIEINNSSHESWGD